jgi:hypothetical protein
LGGAGDDTHGGPDPTVDHTPGSDNRVLGNDLTSSDGDYEPTLTQTYWITSPIIDCSSIMLVQLEFWRWLGVERNLYDHAYVQAFNGTSWVTVWENGSANIDDQTWAQQLIDVSGQADDNSNFRIRFGIGITDDGWQFCGWNIDDVTVFGYRPGLPVVTNVMIGRSGTNSMRLSWAQVAGATHYRIYRSTTPDFEIGPSNLLIEIAHPTTAYVDSGVLELYPAAFYKITARD